MASDTADRSLVVLVELTTTTTAGSCATTCGTISGKERHSALPQVLLASAPVTELPALTEAPDLPQVSLELPLSETLDHYERVLIERALSAAGGNVTDAARRLRTDRPNLYRRMRRLGIVWDAMA